jgi:PT repeat
LKEIRDYLRANRVYIRKEARKLIVDGLLGAIHEPTPLKWPTDDPTNDPTDDPTDNPTDGPTNDPTPALPLLLTAPV